MPPSSPAAVEAHPRLVVLLIVDQLPSESFARIEPLLRGGVGKLARGGIYYRAARFPFASTYTAPGHATIGTGAPPARSGILANSWYRRDHKREISAVSDSRVRLLIAPGNARPAGSGGVSGQQLQVDGIADVLRTARRGRARSVSIALKDRGAALALGRRPDLVLWYEPALGAMTTSTAYVADLPPWLTRLNHDKPPKRFFRSVWHPTDAVLLARHTGSPDNRDGEGSDYDLGTTFPHRLAETNPAAKAVRATPFGTEIIFDAAIAAIDGERLGVDSIPDILAISVSSHDYAGHFWGPDSWERADIMLRLDGQVTRLLRHLDRVVGKGRYAVVLTSDHGATPLVESSRSKGKAARRIPASELRAAANRAARTVLGDGEWVEAISASALYVPATVPADKRTQTLTAMAAAVVSVPGIAFAAPTASIAGDCRKRRGIESMACRSIRLGLSGDVYFVAERYHVMTTTYRTGTSHGSPNPEDTDVPVVIYDPARHPARRVGARVSMLRMAATLCQLLGIPAPPASTEPPLP